MRQVAGVPRFAAYHERMATECLKKLCARRLQSLRTPLVKAMPDDKSHIYRVYFHSHGQIYEVYARSVYPSDLYGFVEIEDYIFGEKSKMVIDPSEDKLRTEFESVQRSFVPMHAIIRIDEVENEGTAKITDGMGNNVTPFPMPLPGKKG